MVLCHSCQKVFEDYKELALHIQSNKKGHRKGKKWAARYIMRVRQLDKKKELNGRVPMTEEQKENRRDNVRELSGETEQLLTICPHCKKGHRELLPVEFSQSRDAWQVKDRLVVLCPICGGV